MGGVSANSITLQSGLDSITLTLDDKHVTILKQSKTKPSHHELIHSNIIRALFDAEKKDLSLTYLKKKKHKDPFKFVVLEGRVQEDKLQDAPEWVENVMAKAYTGVQRHRRFLIFVNPHGGTKQGAALFTKKVYPILKAAGSSMEVIHTTHQGHAHDVCKTLALDFDGILTVSGDGLVHEVLNGLAQHSDPIKALATPIAPIPTGSGNGLSLNLLGIDEGMDVSAATLNALKGRKMKVDLFSLTQGDTRIISFMSQALGLMADLDLGTEHLRWMGPNRFVYGLLRGLIAYKPCPIRLSFKLAENDKHKMAQVLQVRKQQGFAPSTADSGSSDLVALPPLQHTDDRTGWTTFDEPILYVYAGKGPYVSRDLMAFPVSLPDDGLIDLIAFTHTSSRGDLLTAMDGALKGDGYWHPKVNYFKAHAFRVEPLTNKGYLSVDGEPYPFKEFQVEVHRGLGTFLSRHGHYVAPFEPRTQVA